MHMQTHSFRRPDGSILTISTTTGEGVSVVELVEQPAQEPAMEPSDEEQL